MYWALLVVSLLVPRLAAAVETMRIAMGEGAPEILLESKVLSFGQDAEDAHFQPLGDGRAHVSVRGGRLFLDGVPWAGDALRFRAGAHALDAGVPGRESVRAGNWEVRGDVVVRKHQGVLLMVNVISLEDYLAGVLGSEMPVSFPLEALKAQAVAARTYALKKKLDAYDRPFHLGSGVIHQVYGGLSREDARTLQAVEATRGQVLTHELEPIEAYFHASCGGRTESGLRALSRDLPYLQSVSCPCGGHPASRWSLTLSVSELRKVTHGALVDGLKVVGRSETGRAERVALSSGRTMEASAFRQRVGYARLKSLDFEVERLADAYRLKGRGYGHGAGMCQWGAKVLAERRTSYLQILAHYYPGTELQTLY